MFGLTMDEGAAVLGEAPVYADGSWLADVPPYIPMHLQPIDKFGLAIRNQRLWIQGMPGEDRRCVGCHESRTGHGVAGDSARTRRVAEQQGPDELTEPIAERTEYPVGHSNVAGGSSIQPILDAKCVSCHNDTTNGSGPQTFYTIGFTDPVTRRDDAVPDPDVRPLRSDGEPVLQRPAGHRPLRPRHVHVAGLVRLDLLPGGDADDEGHHAAQRHGAADVGHPGRRARLRDDREDERDRARRHDGVAHDPAPDAPREHGRDAHRRRSAKRSFAASTSAGSTTPVRTRASCPTRGTDPTSGN